MSSLRRYKTATEQKVAAFDMVTFFKVPPPDRISETIVGMPDPSKVPLYRTRTISSFTAAPETQEQVKEYEFNSEIFKYTGDMYLFTGSVELYEVTDHEVLEDPDRDAKDGYRLKMVIRRFAGEYWGTVWYDYLYLNEGNHTYKAVNPLRDYGVISTIEEVVPDKYIVFVDYQDEDAAKKVAVGMEPYPSDQPLFETAIEEYERSLLSLTMSRQPNFSQMLQFDASDEDLPTMLQRLSDD